MPLTTKLDASRNPLSEDEDDDDDDEDDEDDEAADDAPDDAKPPPAKAARKDAAAAEGAAAAKPRRASPFLAALSPILFTAFAILVASDFDATADYLLWDAGLLDDCAGAPHANASAAWFTPLHGADTKDCGWTATGMDAAKSAVTTLLSGNLLVLLEGVAARAGLAGSSPTVASVSKAFFMWVGWMWSATVDSAAELADLHLVGDDADALWALGCM